MNNAYNCWRCQVDFLSALKNGEEVKIPQINEKHDSRSRTCLNKHLFQFENDRC